MHKLPPPLPYPLPSPPLPPPPSTHTTPFALPVPSCLHRSQPLSSRATPHSVCDVSPACPAAQTAAAGTALHAPSSPSQMPSSPRQESLSPYVQTLRIIHTVREKEREGGGERGGEESKRLTRRVVETFH